MAELIEVARMSALAAHGAEEEGDWDGDSEITQGDGETDENDDSE
jgi:hypothetical protein